MPTTWNCSDCSSTETMTQYGHAAIGDKVQLPAGSGTWAAGSVTIDRAITIQGVATSAPAQGAGTSTTVIDVSGTVDLVTFQINKQAGGLTWIKDIRFTATDNAGPSGEHPVKVSGAWLTDRPVIFQNCTFDCSGATMLLANTAGGVIFSHCTFNGEWNDFFMTAKCLSGDNTTSWTVADSMGMNDTTGEKNFYMEDCAFYGGANGVIDVDDNGRFVDRHNLYVRSGGFNSHGKDTSPYGARHWEVYENTYTFPIDPANANAGTWQKPFSGSSYANNVNFYMWFRGGTGVVFNNSFEDIYSTAWGDKTELWATIRGIQDSVFSNYPGGCGTVTYPCPHQLGQNNNGSADFTDPIYVWNNSGTFALWGQASFAAWGNPCGLTYSDFWQSGRDYILSGGDGKGATAKPGYTAYTYPHPLLDVAPETNSPAVLLPMRMCL